MRSRIGVCLAFAATAGLPGTASGGAALLGGFRPVAAEESARAVWVNPASIGMLGLATGVGEVVWRDEFGQFLGYNIAVATDRFAYAFQWDSADRPGVPEWTAAVGGRTTRPGPLRFGWTAEYRGGEDQKFDATLGFDYSFSRNLRASLVVIDVLDRTVDGVESPRTWRPGASLRTPSLKGRFTYDAILQEGVDTRHWFGVAIDRTKFVHGSFTLSTEGDWNATLDLVLPNFLLGGGRWKEDGASDRTFVAIDWRDQSLPGGLGSTVDTGFPGSLRSQRAGVGEPPRETF